MSSNTCCTSASVISLNQLNSAVASASPSSIFLNQARARSLSDSSRSASWWKRT